MKRLPGMRENHVPLPLSLLSAMGGNTAVTSLVSSKHHNQGCVSPLALCLQPGEYFTRALLRNVCNLEEVAASLWCGRALRGGGRALHSSCLLLRT